MWNKIRGQGSQDITPSLTSLCPSVFLFCLYALLLTFLNPILCNSLSLSVSLYNLVKSDCSGTSDQDYESWGPQFLILMHLWIKYAILLDYHIDPKFSDRYAWANSADPDQRSRLIRVYTVCNSGRIFLVHYSLVKPSCSNFRVIIAFFWVSEYLGNLHHKSVTVRTFGKK